MSVAVLSAELEAALVRELVANYVWFDELFFGRKLRPPLITLSYATDRFGLWRSDARVIEISRKLVLERPWPEVLEVLKHEMAHQFVYEVLGVRDETAHGPTFRKVCEERAIDARASGLPTADAEAPRVLERIQRLFALAESDNRHEAEAAMRKAHELMLRYNIESIGTRRDYAACHLGDPTKRRTSVERDVIALLTKHFFVRAIEIPVYVPALGKRGHVYEICGTQANVDFASHVYAFLVGQAERFWARAKKEHRVPGRERIPYQSGVVRGFREKLELGVTELRGSGLVWRGDVDLDRFYQRRHPRVRSVSRSQRMSAAHALGREHGKSIVLHRPIRQGGSGEPKRLGS